MNSDQIQLYPPWRQAIELFLKSDFKPDDVVSFDWLFNAFDIRKPLPTTPKAEADKAELQFLGQFKHFEKELLERHQIHLTNERGLGYRLIPPAKQTAAAYEEGIEEFKKALRRACAKLVNTDLASLGAEKRKENADALAKIGMMAGMVHQAKKLTFLPTPEESDPERT